MTDNPSVPTVPRRTVLQVAHAGYAGVAWIIRQVFFACTWAAAVYGLFFALLCFGSALPMFSRQVIFHPGTVLWLKAGFVLIVAIYLLWVLSYVTIRFMGRMAERYPILEKIGVGLLLLVILLLVAGMVYTGWNAKPASFPTPDVTAPQIQALPPDRVLLHMHIATPHRKKLPATLPPPCPLLLSGPRGLPPTWSVPPR